MRVSTPYCLSVCRTALVAISLSILAASSGAHAFTIVIASDAFDLRTDVFSSVDSFSIEIEVLEPLAPGSYANPVLGDIEFLVSGALDPTTPARTANPQFTNFAVDDRAALSGDDFYAQGNSLTFEIDASANLVDGLQVAELVGAGLVFEFDGRELGTGRYHPPLLQLFDDGTGSIRNAANTGGINPFTMVEVNAIVGDEYIQTLAFDPTAFTLVVPEPSTSILIGLGLVGFASMRRGSKSHRPGRR